MMTMDGVGRGLDVVLVGLYAGLVVFAVVMLGRLRSERGRTMFGRTVRRPGVWASGLVCLGVSGLLRSANKFELTPAGWVDPVRFLDLGLTIAFVVLIGISLVGPRGDRGHETR